MSLAQHERVSRQVTIAIEGADIHVTLAIPEDARGLVILAHASDSNRDCPGTMHVASILNDASLATLACDLLTTEEEMISELTGEFRLDTRLMADRLRRIVQWCATQPALAALPIGILALGAGGAAALSVATQPDTGVRAVVLYAGALDATLSMLRAVDVATLFVAGADDMPGRIANAAALKRVGSEVKHALVIPEADNVMMEPRAREQLGEHAAVWFNDAFTSGTGQLALTAEIC